MSKAQVVPFSQGSQWGFLQDLYTNPAKTSGLFGAGFFISQRRSAGLTTCFLLLTATSSDYDSPANTFAFPNRSPLKPTPHPVGIPSTPQLSGSGPRRTLLFANPLLPTGLAREAAPTLGSASRCESGVVQLPLFSARATANRIVHTLQNIDRLASCERTSQVRC